ncbi:MAG TPA: aldose epimerase family protein [Planctomycetota bacterium]|jgi:aldose 1-epimerase
MNLTRKTFVSALATLAILLLVGCEDKDTAKQPVNEKPKSKASITKAEFGAIDGTPVQLYTLTNANGLEAKITNFGGIVVSLKVPDRTGKLDDVTLGFEKVEDYNKDANPYFGATIGRYGNRIAKGKFTLDGKTYTLAINNAPNALHGGLKGFNRVIWAARDSMSKDGPSLELAYTAKDGEEGYPGNLAVKVVYTLTDKNELKITNTATTDKATVLNLTHHSYFNLCGAMSEKTILDHEIMIKADKFTPVDETLIPTGVLQPVKGTPLDFTKPMTIGARINQPDQQLKFGGGYDHNWVLNSGGGSVELAVRLTDPTSGRIMEVLTDEPGMQFYCGNFLDGTLTGKGGKAYKQRMGLCLEPQHFPDSPNKPEFQSCVLKPGKTFQNTIIYKFSAK